MLVSDQHGDRECLLGGVQTIGIRENPVFVSDLLSDKQSVDTAVENSEYVTVGIEFRGAYLLGIYAVAGVVSPDRAPISCEMEKN